MLVGVLRVVFDVLEQGEGLPVEQQQELGQEGAPKGGAGLQHEHLGEHGTGISAAGRRSDGGGHCNTFLEIYPGGGGGLGMNPVCDIRQGRGGDHHVWCHLAPVLVLMRVPGQQQDQEAL